MKLKNIPSEWDIRAGDVGVVVAEMVIGEGASKLKMTFGLSAKDAGNLGRAFSSAARAARSKTAAAASTRIAARLLKKAGH